MKPRMIADRSFWSWPSLRMVKVLDRGGLQVPPCTLKSIHLFLLLAAGHQLLKSQTTPPIYSSSITSLASPRFSRQPLLYMPTVPALPVFPPFPCQSAWYLATAMLYISHRIERHYCFSAWSRLPPPRTGVRDLKTPSLHLRWPRLSTACELDVVGSALHQVGFVESSSGRRVCDTVRVCVC